MLTIKGKGRNLNLHFTTDTAFSSVIDDLEKEKSFLKDANCSIFYSGIKLSYDEEMIFEKTLKNISPKLTLKKKNVLSQEQIEYSLAEDEKILRVIRRNVRSGEVIESRGDMVVYGDVNPGALLRAQGNITVIGNLRGAAHIAKEGRVFATYMSPSQIKIGEVCSYNKKGENVGCAMALAEKGEIILECL